MSDLLEYYYVDLQERPHGTPMSDILQFDDADKLEYAPEMEVMIKKGLLRLEACLDRPTQGGQSDLVPMEEKCVAALRGVNF